MKTIKNILGVVMALVSLTVLNSCDDEVEYTPAEKLDSAQVFFPSTNVASLDLSGASSSFEVSIARVKTDDAITVPLTLTGGEGLYTAPASVSFSQGQATATISISYDVEKLEPNVYSDLTLTIADESMTTPYGMASYTISVGLPETWTARYIGDYVYSYFFSGVDPGLTLYQSDLYPNHWKIPNWGNGTEFCFDWNQETNEVLVYDQWMYNHSSYGAVNVADLVIYTGNTNMGQSYYEDGVFHFNIVYYVDAGTFGYGYDETFTISGPVKN